MKNLNIPVGISVIKRIIIMLFLQVFLREQVTWWSLTKSMGRAAAMSLCMMQ